MIEGAYYIFPYLRPFPIWRYGPLYDMDGRYYRHGWRADPYGYRVVKAS